MLLSSPVLRLAHCHVPQCLCCCPLQCLDQHIVMYLSACAAVLSSQCLDNGAFPCTSVPVLLSSPVSALMMVHSHVPQCLCCCPLQSVLRRWCIPMYLSACAAGLNRLRAMSVYHPDNRPHRPLVHCHVPQCLCCWPEQIESNECVASRQQTTQTSSALL